MPSYVIRVYEELNDADPVRTVRVEAESAEVALTLAAREAASREKRSDADPLLQHPADSRGDDMPND
jgi:hypothetical protein